MRAAERRQLLGLQLVDGDLLVPQEDVGVDAEVVERRDERAVWAAQEVGVGS